jgi:hypothetical protein
MPDLSTINWLAVLACVVLSMVSGFIWYHPKLFFPAWWAGIGKAGELGNPNPMIYVFTIIAALIQACSCPSCHWELPPRRRRWLVYFRSVLSLTIYHQAVCRSWLRSGDYAGITCSFLPWHPGGGDTVNDMRPRWPNH